METTESQGKKYCIEFSTAQSVEWSGLEMARATTTAAPMAKSSNPIDQWKQ